MWCSKQQVVTVRKNEGEKKNEHSFMAEVDERKVFHFFQKEAKLSGKRSFFFVLFSKVTVESNTKLFVVLLICWILFQWFTLYKRFKPVQLSFHQTPFWLFFWAWCLRCYEKTKVFFCEGNILCFTTWLEKSI